MNTATVLHLKGEFESLLDSMNTFCEKPHAMEPQTIEQVKAFYSKLLWINSPLKNEQKNHQAFGELDKLELIANESEQNAWYQNRSKLEKMTARMIEQSSVLILLCQILQSNPSQKTFDFVLQLLREIVSFIWAEKTCNFVLQLLREIVSFIQKELASLENQDSHFNDSIEDFGRLQTDLNTFVSQADQVKGEQAIKLIDELKLKVEHYQLFTQEKLEKVLPQEAEVKPQKQLESKHQQAEDIQQQISDLKRQHQEQLQNREAELSVKYKEQIRQREAELSLQHQEQLEKSESQLKHQHQEQLKRRETELLAQINQLQKQITEVQRQHQDKTRQGEAESTLKINELQQHITKLRTQEAEKIKQTEAELSLQHQQQLTNYESQLKLK
ncbi:MAG: hypothetical protein WBB43_02220, partial [Limnoraphis sp.]